MIKRSKFNLCGDRQPSERGAAIITALFSLLLITVIAFALASVGIISLNVSANNREHTEAFYISEAGLTHAANLVIAAGKSEFTNILRAGDREANTGDELSTQPTDRTPIFKPGLPFAQGRYVVRVRDDEPADGDGNLNTDSNGRLVITSVGLGRNGSTVTTEAIIGFSSFPAILVESKLRINGNPTIRGPSGAVHANGRLDFAGNPCADQYFSSASNIGNPNNSRSGAGCGGPGANRPNQPPIEIPSWNIRTDFRHRADFILGAIEGSTAGNVYDRTGAEISSGGEWVMDPHNGSKWSWDSSNKKWTHGGPELPDGTYYSEGNFVISANFGSESSPARVTLIAEGYIDVSGNPFIKPNLDDKFSLMAGTDLGIGGNAGAGSVNSEGIHYAGHQIKFNGNPRINGVIMAKNLADTDSPGNGGNFIPLEAGGYMEISGQVHVTYDGGFLNSTPALFSWREVRGN